MGQETIYYLDLTRRAVIKFQEAYASDILSPWGLTTGTGLFAEYSRNKAHEMMR